MQLFVAPAVFMDGFPEPVFKVAEADEGQGADGAQQLSVHKVLDGASTGATKPVAASVDCEGRFSTTLPKGSPAH